MAADAKRGGSEVLPKHVRHLALETLKNLVEALKGGALLSTFQSVKRGLRNAKFASERGIRRIAPLLTEKRCKLFVQR